MNTLYSHAIRVLVCQGCGAPFDATLHGGQIKCTYCQATNVVTQRDEQADRQRAQEALAAPISESERYAQLRLQDAGAEALPESLKPWLANGALHPRFLAEAQQDWQLARQQLAAGSQAFSLAERLFYLTVLMADHLDERRQRALLETAAELLTDARHRHVVRCMLARLAAQHGDVAGAEAWLKTCNSRPTDLIMDTAYRHAAATLAIAQGNTGRVFDLVGHRVGDVPLADRHELACGLLRIHAVEKSGRLEQATNELRSWIQQLGASVIERAIAAHAPLALCSQAYANATRAESAASDEATLASLRERRGKIRTGVSAFIGAVARAPGWALVLLVAVAVVRCSTDSDPLMGVYGVPLCPKVCSGCTGPTRTVTVWSQRGPGEWTSNGAQYFCSSPRTDVRAMSSGQLESLAFRLSSQELGTLAAAGSTFLILLVFVCIFVPLIGAWRHMLNAGRAEALDAEIAEVSRRLGRAPPPLERPFSVPKQALAAVGGVVGSASVAFLLILLSLVT